MPQNFIPVQRDQPFLMPHDIRDWLPEDDFAWCLLDAIDEMDLTAFYADYRADGWGRAAFEPKMMVALLLYGYSMGVRSSREIERRCHHDIAFRVVAANLAPDHSTISRFLHRHDVALGRLFKEVLALCARAGLIRLDLVVIDGTKMKANASRSRTLTEQQIDELVEAMLEEAKATDAEEDARFGEDRRGDELAPHLAERSRRIEELRRAKAQLQAERDQEQRRYEEKVERRRNYQRDHGRLAPGKEPLPPSQHQRRRSPRVNLTDPSAQMMHTPDRWITGYNAQLISTQDQIVIAAGLGCSNDDKAHLPALLAQAQSTLAACGVTDPIENMAADAGYLAGYNCAPDLPDAPEMYIAVRNKLSKRPPSDLSKSSFGRSMQLRVETQQGKEIMRRRGEIVEAIFGQIKSVRRAEQFMRRGFERCLTEWTLLTTTHNLLKLWRATVRPHVSATQPAVGF